MILLRAMILLILLLPAHAWAGLPTHWQLCDRGKLVVCRTASPEKLTLTEPITTLVGTVELSKNVDGTFPALAVDLDAMASADVHWNGTLIGRNGVVGLNRATEVAGDYSASIPVPATLIREGQNLIVIQLSAHHLWAPVSRPIHRIEVDSPGAADAYTLRHYVPTLATLALPAMALAILLLLFRSGEVGRSAILPAAILGLVVFQGCLETSKLVLTYTYPWHLARLVALTSLTAIVALLLVPLAAMSFAPAAVRVSGLCAVSAMAIVILAVSGLDQQALALFQTGLAIVVLITAGPVRRRDQYAVTVFLAVLGVLTWSCLAGPAFLDRGYYNVAAIASVSLCLVAAAKRTTIATHEAVSARPNEEAITVCDGVRQHILRPTQITHVKADDDYCWIYFLDGHEIMVTMPLKALLLLLPTNFVRIHRSHAVNVLHLASVRPGSKGSRIAVLQDGVVLPIGRTFAFKLLEALG